MFAALKSKKLLATFFQGIAVYVIFGLLNTFASVYVSDQIGQQNMSILYTVVYVIISLFVVWAPRTQEITHTYHIGITTVLLFVCSGVGLLFNNIYVVIGAFCIYFIADFIQRYVVDVYLEMSSREDNTGFVRGLYLSITNLVLIIATYAAGNLLETHQYSFIFTLVGAITIAMLLVLWRYMKIPTPERIMTSVRENTSSLLRKFSTQNKDVIRVILLNGFLYIFYTLMWVYVPLYLKNTIGLAWSDIGLIISLALIPFVVVDVIAGELADKYWGEKEMMTIGASCMGLGVLGIGLYTGTSFIWWAVLMIGARFGAALYEIMTETYFFKQVKSSDTELILFFRGISSFSRLFTTAFASIVLIFGTLQQLILLIAVILLSSLLISNKIKDTK